MLDKADDFALMEKFLAISERDIDHYLDLIRKMLTAGFNGPALSPPPAVKNLPGCLRRSLLPTKAAASKTAPGRVLAKILNPHSEYSASTVLRPKKI